MPQSRREFLSLSAKASALALAHQALFGLLPSRIFASTTGNPLPLPQAEGLYGLLRPTAPLTLTATDVPGLLPATGSRMLAYEARQEGRLWRNPILVLQKGQDFRARLVNKLDEPTIIHWHGVDGDWRQAGHPSYAVAPGGHYDYGFPITNRAGTYWYHPHPHGLTAKQSYLGLASFFLVRDAEEEALSRELDLTLGVTDIPIVLQDKRFDAHGGLVYAPGKDDLLMGYLGTEVLANGARQPSLNAATRLYRLRLLNGCTARIFNLRFLRDGRPMPFALIGNDGGLLDAPRTLDAVFLAPGERVELLLDLRGMKPGQEVILSNATFDPMHNEDMGDMPGMGHGAGHGAGSDTPQSGGHTASAPGEHGASSQAAPLAEGASYPILRLRVDRVVSYDRRIPARLSSLTAAAPALAGGAPRRFDLALDRHHGRWTIAGLTFDMNAAPVVVERRAPTAWEFAGAKDGMPHPMHLHGYFFRVVSRRGSPQQVGIRAVDATGRLATDLGLKDTVLVWPGESVTIVTDFGFPSYAGEQTFLLHCHNLEHEDQGMMLNVRVKETDGRA
ncbi:MAG: multicopper oxidase domain-containing protein [Humidesulfovibrio sp.]|uniref:multicopper oxidase family protein n=1 Tax=Humidesulfovibrio sp. TaxID=2910988 RepID=UPI0027329A67|nr:multicopper oxidase domain-containing protein [Humidesulfovibrio sp.]MDP2846777.1 multicopper oxidase domain-containing protein [Humidesulfovibrio sp.]